MFSDHTGIKLEINNNKILIKLLLYILSNMILSNTWGKKELDRDEKISQTE